MDMCDDDEHSQCANVVTVGQPDAVDREETSTYTLTITATDAGATPLSSDVDISVYYFSQLATTIV